MARVAVRGGGVYDKRRYLCRPVESGPAFRNLTQLIAKNLPSGVLYVPESPSNAHVSLLDPSTLLAAITKTRRPHKLLPHELIPRLRRAVPESGDRPLSAPIASIQRLGSGDRTLAIIFRCLEADEERERVHLRLEQLGNLGLRRSAFACHASLGEFSERVPSSIMKVAEQSISSVFDLGVVLPTLAELAAEAQHLPSAA